MPDRMPEDLPDRMPEDMSDRMPEDLPVRKCINVMVGITRSNVFFKKCVCIYMDILDAPSLSYTGWWFGTFFFIVFHLLGISSSQFYHHYHIIYHIYVYIREDLSL